jgi:hypothetical protein
MLLKCDHGTRIGTALLVAVIACALAPAAATAAPPVNLPVPSDIQDIAYGAGHVVWATSEGHGPILIHEEHAGTPATVIATIQRAHPSSADIQTQVVANPTGYLLTARDGRSIDTGECGCDYDVSEGELVVRGGWDGSTHDVVRCIPASSNGDQPPLLEAAAGASGFAFDGAQCGTTASVDTVAPDSTVTPIPGLKLDLYPRLSYAEPFLAVETAFVSAKDKTNLHVIDTTHGTERLLPYAKQTSGGAFHVLSDGSLIIGPGVYSGVPRDVYLWPVGVATPHAIPGVQVPDVGTFVPAGGRLLFTPRGDTVGGQLAAGLVGLDGSGLRPVGAPGMGSDRRPILFDGTNAAVLNHSCTGRRQVSVIDVTDSTVPPTPLGCPVQIKSTKVTFDRHGRGALKVVCPNGCDGHFEIYIPATPKQISTRELNRYVDKVFDTHLASGRLRYEASPSTHRVRLELVKPAFALLRKHHRTIEVVPRVGNVGLGIGPQVPPPARLITARLRR